MRIGTPEEGDCGGLVHMWDGGVCVRCGKDEPAPPEPVESPVSAAPAPDASVAASPPPQPGGVQGAPVVERSWDWDAMLVEGWVRWDMRTYLEAPAASSGGLKLMDKAPALYRFDRDSTNRETLAMKLGTLGHTTILEFDNLETDYRVAEPCVGTVGSGSRKGEECGRPSRTFSARDGWLCERHDKGVPEGDKVVDRIIITPEQHRAGIGMRDSVWAHPKARKLLTASGPAEGTGLWKDEATGLWCKMRPDKVDDEHYGAHVSLKTTRDASPEAFSRQIEDLKYHMSAGHYRTGLEALDFDWQHHFYICVESKEPWLCMVHELSEADVEVGQHRCAEALKLLAQCEETGVWPGYPTTVDIITRPPWAWNKDLDL